MQKSRGVMDVPLLMCTGDFFVVNVDMPLLVCVGDCDVNVGVQLMMKCVE